MAAARGGASRSWRGRWEVLNHADPWRAGASAASAAVVRRKTPSRRWSRTTASELASACGAAAKGFAKKEIATLATRDPAAGSNVGDRRPVLLDGGQRSRAGDHDSPWSPAPAERGQWVLFHLGHFCAWDIKTALCGMFITSVPGTPSAT